MCWGFCLLGDNSLFSNDNNVGLNELDVGVSNERYYTDLNAVNDDDDDDVVVGDSYVEESFEEKDIDDNLCVSDEDDICFEMQPIGSGLNKRGKFSLLKN